MSHKLSEALASLSVKSKNVEDKFAQAKTEGKEKLDAEIAEAKSYAENLKNEFISKANTAKAGIDEKVSSAKNSIQEKVDQILAQANAKKDEVIAKVAAKKQEFTLKEAEWEYNNAVDYAQNCIDWAVIALADVQEATLEVLVTKAKLDDLKKAGK
jgi:hypothetical protein